MRCVCVCVCKGWLRGLRRRHKYAHQRRGGKRARKKKKSEESDLTGLCIRTFGQLNIFQLLYSSAQPKRAGKHTHCQKNSDVHASGPNSQSRAQAVSTFVPCRPAPPTPSVPGGVEVHGGESATVHEKLHIVEHHLLGAGGRPRAQPGLPHRVLEVRREQLVF